VAQKFVWLLESVLLAVHEQQLAEHGGGVGVRDLGLLQSALARPQNLAAYGAPDVADCAAAYACGIARNHPFVDGNKRSAFVALELFIELNGWSLDVDDADAVRVMLAVAVGSMEETELALWIRVHCTPSS
jgi:death-on-curing protein